MRRLVFVLDNDPSDFEKITRYLGDAYEVKRFSQDDLAQRASETAAVFVRMDGSIENGLTRFRAVRTAYGEISLVWMSARPSDAVDAFAHNAEAFLPLPPTEATVRDVARRLARIAAAKERDPADSLHDDIR